jgi:hypothetical protein
MGDSDAVILEDIVPRELREDFDLKLLVLEQTSETKEFIRFATQECVFFVLGLSVVRSAAYLLKLNCECCGCTEDIASEICAACTRSDRLHAGGSVSDEEMSEALGWIHVTSLLESAKLGTKIDLAWIASFLENEWKNPTCLPILKNSLAPYLLPPKSRTIARRRLVGRLTRLATYPLDCDDEMVVVQ